MKGKYWELAGTNDVRMSRLTIWAKSTVTPSPIFSPLSTGTRTERTAKPGKLESVNAQLVMKSDNLDEN